MRHATSGLGVAQGLCGGDRHGSEAIEIRAGPCVVRVQRLALDVLEEVWVRGSRSTAVQDPRLTLRWRQPFKQTGSGRARCSGA